MPDPDSIIRPVQRTLNALVVATVVLFLAIGGVAAFTYITSDRNKDALCTLRGDLEARVQQSKDFLIEHPNGAFGFSPAQIKEGITNQQRTIDALGGLSC